jgi:hypothetical protein
MVGHVALYNVSVKCPHCGNTTFVDEMDTGKFRWAEGLLKPALHAMTCGHCTERFGSGGTLVRTPLAS